MDDATPCVHPVVVESGALLLVMMDILCFCMTCVPCLPLANARKYAVPMNGDRRTNANAREQQQSGGLRQEAAEAALAAGHLRRVRHG